MLCCLKVCKLYLFKCLMFLLLLMLYDVLPFWLVFLLFWLSKTQAICVILTCCHRCCILLKNCFAGTVSDSNKSNTNNQGFVFIKYGEIVESSMIKSFEESKS